MQPCFPIIVRYVLLSFDVVMGIAFVLAFLAVRGVLPGVGQQVDAGGDVTSRFPPTHSCWA